MSLWLVHTSLTVATARTASSTTEGNGLAVQQSLIDPTEMALEASPGEVAVLQPEGGWETKRVTVPALQARSTGDLRKWTAEQSRQGQPTRLAFYPKGLGASPEHLRVALGKMTVIPREGSSIAEIAQSHGLAIFAQFGPVSVLKCPETRDPLASVEALQADPRVERAYALLGKRVQRFGIPNDDEFVKQWHLRNTGAGTARAGIDLRVTDVWGAWSNSAAGYRGRGIRIGVVDDGVQHTHSDLQANYDTTTDFDWNDDTPNDPMPNKLFDFHGTAVAGIIAARGNNSQGVCGVAPRATLVGLRLLGGLADEADMAASQAYMATSAPSSVEGSGTTGGTTGPTTPWSGSWNMIHIKNNSWGNPETSSIMAGQSETFLSALRHATTHGRNGLGSVLVFSAGNGRLNEGDANINGYGNSIYGICVAACSDSGGRAEYSTPGSCVAITAPSYDYNQRGVATTDITGTNGYNAGGGGDLLDSDYTKTFSGTSASAPMISGVCALMLEANPNLGWRDVKEILIRTARRIDSDSDRWHRNGAGFWFNDDYGAGLADANAAVAMVHGWKPLAPMTFRSASATENATPIPDGSTTGVSSRFRIRGGRHFRVEQVVVTVQASHYARNNLKINLTSPSGMVSHLVAVNLKPGPDYNNWNFMSVQHWGEEAQGDWMLKITDERQYFAGTYSGASIKIYGVEDNRPMLTQTELTVVGGDAFSQKIDFFSPTPTSDSGTPTGGTGTTPTVPPVLPTVRVTSPLPMHISFDPLTMTLSGTPTLAQMGTYPLTFEASNAYGTSVIPLILTIASGRPVFVSPQQANGFMGSPFSHVFTATSDTLVQWRYEGTLPAGLSFNALEGTITGTPTAAGQSAIKVFARNTSGESRQDFTLGVLLPIPQFTSADSASAPEDQPFTFSFAASQSPASIIITTPLPPGLSYDQNARRLVGSPTTPGLYILTVEATNTSGTGTQNFTLRVTGQPPAFTSPLIATTEAARPWSYRLTTNVSGVNFRFEGERPPWLGMRNGLLEGTPSAPGVYTFEVAVESVAGIARGTFTLTVTPVAGLAIISPRSATFVAGVYSSFQALANLEDLQWTATPPPPSDAEWTPSGLLVGIIAESGTYPIRLRASAGGASVEQDFTLYVINGPPAFTSAAGQTVTTGAYFEFQFTATNRPAGWSLSPPPPVGLSFNPLTGVLSGRYPEAASLNFTVSAANLAGTTSVPFKLTVTDPAPQPAPFADPDADGITNIVEEATGSNPAVHTTAPVVAIGLNSDRRSVLTFKRMPAMTTCVYDLQCSQDGRNWTTLARSNGGQRTVSLVGSTAVVSETSGTANQPTIVTVTDEGAAAQPSRYYRLKLTQ